MSSELRHTMPASFYSDPEYFRREAKVFFGEQWIAMGRADQIPKAGDFFVREFLNESLITVRGKDGKIRVFHNVCRHRGTRFCESKHGNYNGSIQCPYHAWTWGLDGKMTGAPHMTETPGFAMEDHPLLEAACDVWEGNIFAHLGKNPAPLADQIGAMMKLYAPWRMAELRLGKRIVYDIAANWKLVIQNYSECLHCPMVHPALSKLSNYMSGDNEPWNLNYLGGTMTLKDGVRTMTMSGQTTREALPGLSGKQLNHVYYYALLPNLLLSAHPDYVMTHLLWPKAENRTEIVCDFHFHPSQMEKPGFSAEDAAEFWDVTNKQDWHVSELSQKGISSWAYVPGPYSHRETLLWGMDEVVKKRMGL